MPRSSSTGRRAPKPARDRALDLLARRPHFAAELRAKLDQRGYSSAEVETALDRLAEDGYLNEAETARVLVGQLRRRGYGHLRIQRDLRRRGADEEAARSALLKLGDEDEVELAERVAARWRSIHERKGAVALARHLERRGFAARTIGAVLYESSSQVAEGEWSGSRESC